MIGESEIILLISTFILFVLFVLMATFDNRAKKEKEEYIRSLNEHDKAVITTYLHVGRWFRKKPKSEFKEDKEVDK